jgi:hypothetical protein
MTQMLLIWPWYSGIMDCVTYMNSVFYIAADLLSNRSVGTRFDGSCCELLVQIGKSDRRESLGQVDYASIIDVVPLEHDDHRHRAGEARRTLANLPYNFDRLVF